MPITATDIVYRLSVKTGAAGDTTAQADVNASLGKYVSTTVITAATLTNLFETTRSTAIADSLALGIKDSSPAVSSVTIELIGQMGEICGTDKTIEEAFYSALATDSDIIIVSLP